MSGVKIKLLNKKTMNCPNCKNPNHENAAECEWCNFVINKRYSNPNIGNLQPISKGECLFFSKHFKKTRCFYEIHKDGIRIVDADEKINLYIKKDIIYNIEIYKSYSCLHFFPIIGSIVRFVILKFSKYKNGFRIVTSKSGKNIMVIKKNNFKTFSLIMTNYTSN